MSLPFSSGGPYEVWLDSYEEAYRNPRIVTSQTCPNCGARGTLQLFFVVEEEDDVRSSAAYWCDNCHYGIFLAPCLSPPEGQRVLRDVAEIPDYKIVPPGGD